MWEFILLCLLGVNFVYANTYIAGVIDSPNNDMIVPLIYEAGHKNVDILVLPTDVSNSEDSYDENVKELSKAASKAGLYLVANLNTKTRCQDKYEKVRSNLVFDRQGSIVSVYRKSLNNIVNCTTFTSDLVSFTTDFGATFGVMMEEDLVLKGVEELKGLRNFVVTGAWASEIPVLSTQQFASTWAYTASANVVSSSGIYAGRAGLKTASGRLLIAELKNNAEENLTVPPVVNPASIQNIPGEDLSQYIIRPLDVEASRKGYKQTVCHRSFCCQFNVKTSAKGSTEAEASYGLAAFDGVRHYGGAHYIGAQNCAVFACAGLYKRSCTIGSVNNNTNIVFEKLTISTNFTSQNSMQYPLILSNQRLPADRFSFTAKTDKHTKLVTIGLSNNENLLTFGIFGRVFEKDYESIGFENKDGDHSGHVIYDYIFTEDVQEFFDYVWIRLRILVLIVSIYVLEMM